MIRVIQTCDGCWVTRELLLGPGAEGYPQGRQAGGWREVKIGVHLCDVCIEVALTKRVKEEL